MMISTGEIRPYVRFVRRKTLDNTEDFPCAYPYDARLFYTLEGEGNLMADGTLYCMKKSSLILINSGVPYQLMTPGKKVRYLVLNFDYTFRHHEKKELIFPAAKEEYNPLFRTEQITFSDAPYLDRVLYAESLPGVEKRLFAIEREYAAQFSFYEAALSHALGDVIVTALRHHLSGYSQGVQGEEGEKILSYVAKNLDQSLTNRQVARHFNYHTNYLSTKIRRYTGKPLHRYVKHLRVVKAAELLLSSDQSLGEIATACGFYDASHLIRCFKEEMKVSPAQYRNRHL